MASNVIRNTWILTRIRVRLAMRNRTFLFFSLIMPLGFLFFFVTIFSKGDTAWTAYILGAILTMTVMGSFWGLSVQLVMFREAGILRRFRLAPLGAGPMLASSILSNYILVLQMCIRDSPGSARERHIAAAHSRGAGFDPLLSFHFRQS